MFDQPLLLISTFLLHQKYSHQCLNIKTEIRQNIFSQSFILQIYFTNTIFIKNVRYITTVFPSMVSKTFPHHLLNAKQLQNLTNNKPNWWKNVPLKPLIHPSKPCSAKKNFRMHKLFNATASVLAHKNTLSKCKPLHSQYFNFF